MRARSPSIGPPVGARNVDAVAAANHHGTQSRRQPSSARDHLQFGFLRQVAKRPPDLAHVGKPLSPEPIALVAERVAQRRAARTQSGRKGGAPVSTETLLGPIAGS